VESGSGLVMNSGPVRFEAAGFPKLLNVMQRCFSVPESPRKKLAS
jgi:hypothetical protein